MLNDKQKAEVKRLGGFLDKVFDLDSEICKELIDFVANAESEMNVSLIDAILLNKVEMSIKNRVLKGLKWLYNMAKSVK